MINWSNLAEQYGKLWELRDRRVDGWPLMSSPVPTAAICATYVVMVTLIGPRFMRGRRPYNLRRFLVAHNAFQGLLGGWGIDYSFRCQPTEKSRSPRAMFVVWFCYTYYLNKFVDMMDTFCFVARKKFDHLSVLHVVHHGIMPLAVWPGVRWLTGGHGTFFGLCNTIIHIIVYTYYLLAALGSEYKKYIFWKRQLTTIQMLQFVLVFAHSAQTLFYEDCEFPRVFAYHIMAQSVLQLGLFAHFYVSAYYYKVHKSNKAA